MHLVFIIDDPPEITMKNNARVESKILSKSDYF